MIFLTQFRINKYLLLFQRPQIALALQAGAILLVWEKFTHAYLFQIGRKIMWLPILIEVTMEGLSNLNMSTHCAVPLQSLED